MKPVGRRFALGFVLVLALVASASAAIAGDLGPVARGPFRAQVPFPFFDDSPSKGRGGEAPRDDAEEEDVDASEDLEPARDYPKPEPRPLPDGPAEALDGFVLSVRFDGIVNTGMGELVLSALERAEREKAQAVLIELDTPGGLVSTTEKMVQAILASKVPVIVYVTPSGAHAASAGTFITLAAHVAAMAPATRLGAAHPVTGSGKDPEAEGGKHMGRKIENDLVAFVEGIAKERNRNVEWAIDAVRRSVSINADRAVELGVIDLIARDRAELLERLDGMSLMVGTRKIQFSTRGVKVVEHQPTLRERILNTLANPGVAMLLGVLGMIGVMIEMYHPGWVVPGVMGVLSILCSLIAMDQLPIDLGAAILVLAGLALLVAEVYTPTHGLLGILGGLGLVLGLLLLIDTDDPGYLVDKSFALGLKDVLPVVVFLAVFLGYLSIVVVRRRQTRPITGREALIGATGPVLRPVDAQGGMVLVLGEYWSARSSESIGVDEQVEVVAVQGLELEVKRMPPKSAA